MKTNQQKVVKLTNTTEVVSSPVVQKYMKDLNERGIAYEVIPIAPAQRKVTKKKP